MDAHVAKISIAGLTPDEVADLLAARNIDRKYAATLTYYIYKKRIPAIAEMTGISVRVRAEIERYFDTGIIPPAERLESADGSVKYIFTYNGERTIEAVFIPEARRNTLCVSTQCGCACSCLYCRTGAMGLTGDLTAGEIVNQLLSIREAATVTHVVFMGMGEPLDNLAEVIRGISILTAEWGTAIGHSHITVSTVGILPALKELLSATRSNITLSLVSPVSRERALLVPAERKYPAAEIIRLMRDAPHARKRRFTVAYMMLAGINDSDDHLNALLRLLAGSAIRVNILRYHPHGDLPYQTSSDERMMYFHARLNAANISTSIRKSRGEDIKAACGLLTGKTNRAT